jgi:ribonucleoside-diphosphate reductase alpha chain
MAGTTTGLEPLFAVAYKRRYIEGNRQTGMETRKFQYYIDHQAQEMIDMYGLAPNEIESASTLAADPERRIAFQADMQDYVDMAISSTLNLPSWGSEHNNEDLVEKFARTVAKYGPRLRGLTFYPDGSRGGQPLVPVPYEEAKEGLGTVFEENSEKACTSGVCGI